MISRILLLLCIFPNLVYAKDGPYSELLKTIPKEFKSKNVVLYHLFKFSEDKLNVKSQKKETPSLNYYLLTKEDDLFILDVGKIDKGQAISDNSFKLKKSYNIKIDKRLRELVFQNDLKFSDLPAKDKEDFLSYNLLKINFLDKDVEVFYYILNEDENLIEKAKIKRKDIIRLQKFTSFLNFIRSLRLKSEVFSKKKQRGQKIISQTNYCYTINPLIYQSKRANTPTGFKGFN